MKKTSERPKNTPDMELGLMSNAFERVGTPSLANIATIIPRNNYLNALVELKFQIFTNEEVVHITDI